jgi:hypothetical protein
MSTTVLAYLILMMGFLTFLAGLWGVLILIFEEVGKTERVPFRYYAVMRPCNDRHWAGPETAAADPWQGSDGAVRRSRHCKNPKHPAVKRETGEDWGR